MSENKWPMNPVDPVENPKAAVKVGDRVIGTQLYDDNMVKSSLDGLKGVVVAISEKGGYQVLLDDNKAANPLGIYWFAKVELLPSEPAVKVGDRVRFKNDGSRFGGMLGTITSLASGNTRMEVKWDNPDGMGPYMDEEWIEVLPPEPASLNGCEHCIHCPVNATKGDVCPERARIAKEKGTSDKSITWMMIGVIPAFSTVKDCAGFVQKTCQNCGRSGKANGKPNVCVGPEFFLSCIYFPDPDKGKHDHWVPPKAEPAQEPDTIGKFISHQWLQKGMEDNFECPKHGGDNYNLIAQSDAGQYLVACGDCIKDRLKALESERKSGAAGNIAPPKGVLSESCFVVTTCKHVDEHYNAFLKERARAEKAEKELARTKENELKWTRMTEEFRIKHAAAEARAQAAEQRADTYQKDMWVMAENFDAADKNQPELTSLKEMLAQQQQANSYLAGVGEKMEAHMPWWARDQEMVDQCKSCRKLSRFRSFLSRRGLYIAHCVCDGCKYEPRYTRQQLHDASLKGQLKAAISTMRTKSEKHDEEEAAMEQKGLDAVAKTVEKDTAILANNDARWSNLVKRLEEKLAASVPLVNAIPCDIVNAEIVEDKHGDGSVHVWQRLRVSLQRDVIFHEPRTELVVFKKAREEKPNES